MAHFEEELKKFRNKTQANRVSVGTVTEMEKLKITTEEITKFCDDIKNNTKVYSIFLILSASCSCKCLLTWISWKSYGCLLKPMVLQSFTRLKDRILFWENSICNRETFNILDGHYNLSFWTVINNRIIKCLQPEWIEFCFSFLKLLRHLILWGIMNNYYKSYQRILW